MIERRAFSLVSKKIHIVTTIILKAPLDLTECYDLAAHTDLLFRKLQNVGLSRKHADALLSEKHTALDLAAVKIIKMASANIHPVKLINRRNLVVLKVVSKSPRRATCLGGNGRLYDANRGHIFPDGRFIATAKRLPTGFALYETNRKSGYSRMKRVVSLKPTNKYIS